MIRRLKLVGFYFAFTLGFVLTWLTCLVDRLLEPRLAFPRSVARLIKRRAWCVKRLTEVGALPSGAEVLSYEVTPFRDGEVFRSQMARVDVSYRHDGATHTLRCVAKFAPVIGSVANRAIFTLQANHLREVGFYRELAARSAGLVPTVYYARAGKLTGNLCVILAYVADQREYGEIEGCSPPAAERAVETLARLHALHWVPVGTAPGRFPPPLPQVAIDFFCSLAWGRRHRTLRRLAGRSWAQGNHPQTLIHGDARVGNMLFAPDGTPTLIDWQAVRWGRGAFDLAYFLMLSLSVDDRRRHEAALIQRYHAALLAHGVSGYELGALQEDFRHACVLTLSMLALPLLSGEISSDDATMERAVTAGLVWRERILAWVAEPAHLEWLADRYDVDPDTLLEDVKGDPPWLNRGARAVAAAERAQKGDRQ